MIVADTFATCGYRVVPRLLNGNEISSWRQAVAGFLEGRAGRRNLFRECPKLIALVQSPLLRALADELLGSPAFAVRAVLFDKTEEANWKIHWHQDSTIAVKRKVDSDGFVGWSVKEGIPHVQPPASVLEKMIALRIHLDDAVEDNGPLRVLPGSHQAGRIDEVDLLTWRERVAAVTLPAESGDVIVMRPLLLHASSASVSPKNRRVVHIEFACDELPGGLEWHEKH